jgi:hypothetical protein
MIRVSALLDVSAAGASGLEQEGLGVEGVLGEGRDGLEPRLDLLVPSKAVRLLLVAL